MFRTFVIAVLGFVAGAIFTYVVVVGGTLMVWEWLDVHDQDGGGAMAIGLVIGPSLALIGGLGGAYLAYLWTVRRRRNAPPQTDEARARDTHRFLIMGGAMVGAYLGYQVAQFGFTLASPIQFDSIWKVRAVSWLPKIATISGALAGGLMVRAWLHR